MQHDTSPHHPVIAGRPRLVHCASLVLCYSRMLYAQVYPRRTRFWCKVFLGEAIAYLEEDKRDRGRYGAGQLWPFAPSRDPVNRPFGAPHIPELHIGCGLDAMECAFGVLRGDAVPAY